MSTWPVQCWSCTLTCTLQSSTGVVLTSLPQPCRQKSWNRGLADKRVFVLESLRGAPSIGVGDPINLICL